MCARRRRAASPPPCGCAGGGGTPLWGQECEEGDGAAASGMWGEWRRRSRGVRASPRARRGAEPGLGRRGVRLGAGARVAERPAVAPRGGGGGGPGSVVRPDRRASGKIPYPRGLSWRRLPQSRPAKYEQLTNVSHILPHLTSQRRHGFRRWAEQVRPWSEALHPYAPGHWRPLRVSTRCDPSI